MTLQRRTFLAAAASPFFFVRSVTAGNRLRIGQPVPMFVSESLQGQKVALESAIRDHKAVIILFTSTVCPYANYFAPHVRDLSEGYASRAALVIGVNSNNWESRQDILDHMHERGFSFPMVKDEGHVIADLFNASRTPEAFLIDGAGRLRYQGWVKSKQESPDLQRALEDVLAGRPVRRPVTKAFGCAVDRF